MKQPQLVPRVLPFGYDLNDLYHESGLYEARLPENGPAEDDYIVLVFKSPLSAVSDAEAVQVAYSKTDGSHSTRAINANTWTPWNEAGAGMYWLDAYGAATSSVTDTTFDLAHALANVVTDGTGAQNKINLPYSGSPGGRLSIQVGTFTNPADTLRIENTAGSMVNAANAAIANIVLTEATHAAVFEWSFANNAWKLIDTNPESVVTLV